MTMTITPRKRGGVRIEDRANTLKALKPWLALGMSERTWYRRQRELREQAKTQEQAKES